MKVIKNIDNKCVSLFLLFLSFETMRLLCLWLYFGSLKNRKKKKIEAKYYAIETLFIFSGECFFIFLSFFFRYEIRCKSKLKLILK